MTTTEELLALLDYVHNRLFDRFEGMSDAEYLWEPVQGCWSVRPDADGEYHPDKHTRDPQPAPFTTIAWRLWHIGVDCLAGYSDNFFDGLAGRDRAAAGFPGTVADGLAVVDKEWARFRDHVEALDDAALARPLGPAAGPFSEDSFHALVLHALDEVIHHTAEIGVIRDLYRASEGGKAWVQA